MFGQRAVLARLSSDIKRLGEESGDIIDQNDSRSLAADVVESEYAPLLEGDTVSEVEAEQTKHTLALPPRIRKVELGITYAAFFVLGSTILLPWNAIIVAQTYFASRLIGSRFEFSFASFVALTFTLGNLVFLARATYTQQDSKPLLRVFASIATIAVVLLFFALSTLVQKIDATVFFLVLLALVAAASAGASYLQNSVVALSALFGSSYLQGILSGQGAIGFGVSLVQLLTAVGTASTASVAALAQDGGLDNYVDALRKTAFIFFLISFGLAVFAFVCHLILVRLPFYRLKVRSADVSEQDAKASTAAPEPASMRLVERKVRTLGWAILFVFLVTLSVFPAITASVLSVHMPDESEGLSFFSPTIFVPFHFVVFNLGDWLGRALPTVRALRFTSTRKLVICSALRVAFVPLFLLCNVTGIPSDRPAIIHSDTVFFLLLLLFSMSNGYISTLIMIAGVELPTLEKQEVDLAATCLAFYLTTGLAAGSLFSFGVRGAICQCNPFVSAT